MTTSKHLIQAAAGVSTGPEGAWDLSYAYNDDPFLGDLSSAIYTNINYSISGQDTAAYGLFFKPDGTKMYVVGTVGDDINEYSLSTPWVVNTASYVQNFSVSSQDNTPYGIFFKPDGTKMYVVGGAGDDINEYTLSTAWNVSTASYTRNFSVSSQETNPIDVFFKSDGTKMYVLGYAGDDVNEYNLSTAWDVSTASYLQNFSVAAQDTAPFAFSFNSDGTKMYVLGSTGQDVNEYTLSTAWDISTASYVQNFSVSAQDTQANGLYTKPDGSGFYFLGGANDRVYQYSLGGFNVASQDSAPQDIFFKPEGDKMYIVGSTNDSVYEYSVDAGFDVSAQDTFPVDVAISSNGTKIYVLGGTNVLYQYSLSTPYDLTTASYDSISFNTSSQATNTYGITFNSDGTKFYGVDFAGSTVYQYSLSTAHDLSTASYDSVSINLSSQDIYPVSIAFKNDGTKMYMVGLANDTVYQYSLSTAYDISTASYDSVSFSPISQDNDPRDLAISSDGTKLYINGYQTEGIYEYDLSTAFDVSTASYSGSSLDKSSQDTNVLGMSLSSDGTKIYIVGYTNDKVYQYNLSTAYDVSTAEIVVPEANLFDLSKFSYTRTFSVTAQQTVPLGLTFKDDGTKMYIIGSTNDDIDEYNLSTAWNISTATYIQTFSVATQETAPQGLYFKSDGTEMYVVGSNSDAVFEYNLSTAWDISTASYASNTFSVAGQETTPSGLFFKDDGTKMYIIGAVSEAILEYDLSTAWDVSTSTYSQEYNGGSARYLDNPSGVYFKPDGTKVFAVDSLRDAVFSFNIGVQE